MADSENAAPDQEFNDNGDKNPDYVAPTDGDEGGDVDPDKKDDKDTDKDTDKDDDKKDKFDDEAEPEIKGRNSNLSHIITRKNETIKKLKDKDKDKDGEDDDEDNDDDDKTPSVSEEVQTQLKPVLEKLASDTDEAELQTLIKNEPDAEKYVKHIRAYMSHDSYKDVPPAMIFHHLVHAHVLALGAKKKSAADLEADQNKSGGRTQAQKDTGTEGVPTPEEIKEMSDTEINELATKTLQG